MSTHNEFAKNILLAIVSSITYGATQLGTNNKNIYRDSFTFGISNGLAQQFVPKLVDNEDFQSLFIDPLIATVTQGVIKGLIYGDSYILESVISKSIVAGVSGSALTLHLYGDKKY